MVTRKPEKIHLYRKYVNIVHFKFSCSTANSFWAISWIGSFSKVWLWMDSKFVQIQTIHTTRLQFEECSNSNCCLLLRKRLACECQRHSHIVTKAAERGEILSNPSQTIQSYWYEKINIIIIYLIHTVYQYVEYFNCRFSMGHGCTDITVSWTVTNNENALFLALFFFWGIRKKNVVYFWRKINISYFILRS